MYFCHGCQNFHTGIGASEQLTQCQACQSPLIERVYSHGQMNELCALYGLRHITIHEDSEVDEILHLLQFLQSAEERAARHSSATNNAIVEELMRTFVSAAEESRSEPAEAMGPFSCRICLDSDDLDDIQVAQLPCQHRYHANCIRSWLQKSLVCPLCRASVLPASTVDTNTTA
ncbi:hypothetical protein, conserved [Trypanosoma brucei gambiense DAL972]|uniref:RING-type E3 ubiquitin transferase n=2 Tax=Trypanosoma brucei TaxID=5691 RepID=D0A158_TRYB9|nr:hypothetical protein, conserved [Trypanosoma brucei gambiense DAL972]RHW69768.1 Ring finger domain containing protein [Trypanosoma brucei equiperdum]CBH15000.1 hypothetical protein, conserved [Trypanosoma brucei gambiense DAL972]|eukprot:XP_011777266.1 hypothetical protein, conserved [Trypanosoma brucei gambiense DAL972]